MPLFRKKPVVIEANQWNGRMSELPLGARITEEGHVYVETIHGDDRNGFQRVYLEAGDWVLPEPDGEHYYPCKPGIFEATYEAVD